VIFEGMMDKRQLFFPFLVSILHDLTGYRPENAFVLNGDPDLRLPRPRERAGRMLAGRMAGWLGVALFAGLPLLAQNATGGGLRAPEPRDDPGDAAPRGPVHRAARRRLVHGVLLLGLLLTQVRYESAIFLVPVAAIILWVWWREGRAILPWPGPGAAAPHDPLRAPQPDLRHPRSAWQLQSKPGFTKPFSLSYVPDNLAHAMGFFFGKPTDQPNSYVFSALGCGRAHLLHPPRRQAPQGPRGESPISVSTLFFTLGFAAQFGLMMCYFWGSSTTR
jgi:hypothetical protein